MWPNPQDSADLVTFTEEILNGNLQSCRDVCYEKIFSLVLPSIVKKTNQNKANYGFLANANLG